MRIKSRCLCVCVYTGSKCARVVITFKWYYRAAPVLRRVRSITFKPTPMKAVCLRKPAVRVLEKMSRIVLQAFQSLLYNNNSTKTFVRHILQSYCTFHISNHYINHILLVPIRRTTYVTANFSSSPISKHFLAESERNKSYLIFQHISNVK